MSVPFRFRGRGLDERVASDLERLAAMVQALQTTPILNQATLPKGQRLLTRADLVGLLGPRAQTLIGETTADPLLVTQPTGNGTVSSVATSSSAGGFGLAGGPITTTGTVTFSITNAANARATLEIPKNNTTNSAPTVNDDSSAGYSRFSMWIDTTGPSVYILEDATVGAANWARFV